MTAEPLAFFLSPSLFLFSSLSRVTVREYKTRELKREREREYINLIHKRKRNEGEKGRERENEAGTEAHALGHVSVTHVALDSPLPLAVELRPLCSLQWVAWLTADYAPLAADLSRRLCPASALPLQL